MNRSEIIERLYELKSNEEFVDKTPLLQLMYDIFHDAISIRDAEIKLRELDPLYTRYEFLQGLKGKPVFKSIIEYKKGNLSRVQIAKMISSLITQILIQSEQNPELNTQSLQVDVLLGLLNNYFKNNTIDNTKLDMILDQYGWKE